MTGIFPSRQRRIVGETRNRKFYRPRQIFSILPNGRKLYKYQAYCNNIMKYIINTQLKADFSRPEWPPRVGACVPARPRFIKSVMASFRFLHCADLHIDSPLRGLEADPDAPTDRIRTATRDAFVNLVDYAIDERVAFVLAAGDLYDGDWQDWRTGQFLMTEIGRLSREQIPFIAIRGNHDAESVITRHLRFQSPAYLFRTDKPRTHEIPEIQVCIHGHSFVRREVRDNLAIAYPPARPGWFNIGLLHTAMEGGRPGHADYAPCNRDQLRSFEYQYWALGHIHTREQEGPDPWIVFPGNLQGRKISETGPKGATLVTVQEGEVRNVEPIPFDTVRWDRVTVELPQDADEDTAMESTRSKLLDAVSRADGRLLAARVVLSGACLAHEALSRDIGAVREKVRAEALNCAGPDAIWIEHVELATRSLVDIAGVRARPGAIGLLVQAIGGTSFDDVREEVQEYCRAMLDRGSQLRDELGDEHPAVRVAKAEVPAGLIDRARDLLLDRLLAEE